MTGRLPTIDDCQFEARPNGKGKFIGRVKQFPDLRAPAKNNSIDALDAIFDLTRDKLAELADAHAGHGVAPHPERNRA